MNALEYNAMIDEVIVDCNSSVKLMIDGNYVSWCNSMALIVKKLAAIKKELSKDGEKDGEN